MRSAEDLDLMASLLLKSFVGEEAGDVLEVLRLTLGNVLAHAHDKRTAIDAWRQFIEYLGRDMPTILSRIGERNANQRKN